MLTRAQHPTKHASYEIEFNVLKRHVEVRAPKWVQNVEVHVHVEYLQVGLLYIEYMLLSAGLVCCTGGEQVPYRSIHVMELNWKAVPFFCSTWMDLKPQFIHSDQECIIKIACVWVWIEIIQKHESSVSPFSSDVSYSSRKDLHIQGLFSHLIPYTYYNWFPLQTVPARNYFSFAGQMGEACCEWLKGCSCEMLTFILEIVGYFSELRKKFQREVPGHGSICSIHCVHSVECLPTEFDENMTKNLNGVP